MRVTAECGNHNKHCASTLFHNESSLRSLVRKNSNHSRSTCACERDLCGLILNENMEVLSLLVGGLRF